MSAPTPDPVLVALAARNPELDPIRWRVRLADNTRELLAGEKVDTDDSRMLRFKMVDGTVREFACGEWTSATAMPGPPGPDLDKIIFRLYMFGLADQHDIINRGAWLQAQPEWIENERDLGADDTAALSDAERFHLLRKSGL